MRRTCILIGYPSGQDGTILRARDCRFVLAIRFRRNPSGCMKVFFCKIFSVTIKRFRCQDGTRKRENRNRKPELKQRKQNAHEFQDYISPGGGGGGVIKKFNTGRLCPEVRPLAFYIFGTKDSPFVYFPLTNGTPFRILFIRK